MPVQIDSPTARQCGEAGWLRWRYKISTADAIIATQAITNDAELVHKDPEFEAIVGLGQQQLHYKVKIEAAELTQAREVRLAVILD